MPPTRRGLLLLGCLLLCALLPGSGAAGEAGEGVPDSARLVGDLPHYDPRDPDAPPVTEQNLLEHDSLWPFWVDLTREWQPPGRDWPLPRGRTAVLLRVEPGGVARLDFGRFGTYPVPVSVTDLVERANQVARGERHKQEPNLLRLIGSQAIDPGEVEAVAFDFEVMARSRAFLDVFADPMSESFAGLAAALATLSERPGLRLVLFPQGHTGTGDVTRRLRALGWKGVFVFPHTSGGFTRSLLAEGTPQPALLLQSPEGRVAFEASWSGDDPQGFSARLAAALDRELGPTLAQEPVSP